MSFSAERYQALAMKFDCMCNMLKLREYDMTNQDPTPKVQDLDNC